MRTYLYIYIYKLDKLPDQFPGWLTSYLYHPFQRKQKNATEREVKGGQRGYMTYKFR